MRATVPSSQPSTSSSSPAPEASSSSSSSSSSSIYSVLSLPSRRVLELALRDDVSPVELVRWAEADPSFAVRLFSLARCAASLRDAPAEPARIESEWNERGLRYAAFGLIATDLLPPGEATEPLMANALRRAVACRLLAQKVGRFDPGAMFMVGLLLELGLLARAREDAEGALAVGQLPAEHRVLIERASGFPPHPAAGAELASSCALPDDIVHAIARHHDVNMPSEPLAAMAWTAERFAAAFEGADTEAAEQRAVHAARRFGLSEHQAREIFAAIPNEVQRAASTLEREVGPQLTLEALREDARAHLVVVNRQYEELVVRLEDALRDKTELTQKLQGIHERLQVIAATDSLTGLLNRRLLEHALERDVARAVRDDSALSVVMVDVDDFKRFNDLHGHQVGDLVLQHVARILERCLRQSDLAARYGGEEFVMLLPAADERGAAVVAERARSLLETEPLKLDHLDVKLTASFGVATAMPPHPEGTAFHGKPSLGEWLIAEADAALYRAKARGRNRVVQASDRGSSEQALRSDRGALV